MTKRPLFLKIVFTVLLLLVSFEVRLRVFSPTPFIRKGEKVVLPANKEYVYINNSSKRLDPVVHVRKNSLGFRGNEPPSDLDKVLSIIVLGGSTAACDNLNEGKTWEDRLQQDFLSDHSRVWINNAGFAGHSSVAHLLLLEDYVVKLKPKVVLFFIGVNDLDAEGQERFGQQIMRGRYQFGSFIEFLRSVNRNVETINFLVNSVQQKLGKKRTFLYADLDLKSTPRLLLSEAEKEKAITAHTGSRLEAYRSRLQSLVDICKAHKIFPVFVTTPSLYGGTIDEATAVDMRTLKVSDGQNVELMGFVMNLYLDETLKLKDQGVNVIDLARGMPKNSVYFSDFYHFTNQGAEKAAEVMYPELKAILTSAGLLR